MPGIKEIVWSDAAYSPDNLINECQKSFPVLVHVTKGYFGTNEIETVSTGQVARLQGYVTQLRVLAEDISGDIISIPLDFPVKLLVQESRKKKKSKPKHLKDIVRHYNLPLQARFDIESTKRGSIRFGYKVVKTAKYGEITILAMEEVTFLLTNTIHDGVIDRMVSLLPTYLDYEMRVARGLKDDHSENAREEWTNLQRMYTSAVTHIDYRTIRGVPDIMVTSAPMVAEGKKDSELSPGDARARINGVPGGTKMTISDLLPLLQANNTNQTEVHCSTIQVNGDANTDDNNNVTSYLGSDLSSLSDYKAKFGQSYLNGPLMNNRNIAVVTLDGTDTYSQSARMADHPPDLIRPSSPPYFTGVPGTVNRASSVDNVSILFDTQRVHYPTGEGLTVLSRGRPMARDNHSLPRYGTQTMYQNGYVATQYNTVGSDRLSRSLTDLRVDTAPDVDYTTHNGTILSQGRPSHTRHYQTSIDGRYKKAGNPSRSMSASSANRKVRLASNKQYIDLPDGTIYYDDFSDDDHKSAPRRKHPVLSSPAATRRTSSRLVAGHRDEDGVPPQYSVVDTATGSVSYQVDPEFIERQVRKATMAGLKEPSGGNGGRMPSTRSTDTVDSYYPASPSDYNTARSVSKNSRGPHQQRSRDPSRRLSTLTDGYLDLTSSSFEYDTGSANGFDFPKKETVYDDPVQQNIQRQDRQGAPLKYDDPVEKNIRRQDRQGAPLEYDDAVERNIRRQDRQGAPLEYDDAVERNIRRQNRQGAPLEYDDAVERNIRRQDRQGAPLKYDDPVQQNIRRQDRQGAPLEYDDAVERNIRRQDRQGAPLKYDDPVQQNIRRQDRQGAPLEYDDPVQQNIRRQDRHGAPFKYDDAVERNIRRQDRQGSYVYDDAVEKNIRRQNRQGAPLEYDDAVERNIRRQDRQGAPLEYDDAVKRNIRRQNRQGAPLEYDDPVEKNIRRQDRQGAPLEYDDPVQRSTRRQDRQGAPRSVARQNRSGRKPTDREIEDDAGAQKGRSGQRLNDTRQLRDARQMRDGPQAVRQPRDGRRPTAEQRLTREPQQSRQTPKYGRASDSSEVYSDSDEIDDEMPRYTTGRTMKEVSLQEEEEEEEEEDYTAGRIVKEVPIVEVFDVREPNMEKRIVHRGAMASNGGAVANEGHPSVVIQRVGERPRKFFSPTSFKMGLTHTKLPTERKLYSSSTSASSYSAREPLVVHGTYEEAMGLPRPVRQIPWHSSENVKHAAEKGRDVPLVGSREQVYQMSEPTPQTSDNVITSRKPAFSQATRSDSMSSFSDSTDGGVMGIYSFNEKPEVGDAQGTLERYQPDGKADDPVSTRNREDDNGRPDSPIVAKSAAVTRASIEQTPANTTATSNRDSSASYVVSMTVSPTLPPGEGNDTFSFEPMNDEDLYRSRDLYGSDSPGPHISSVTVNGVEPTASEGDREAKEQPEQEPSRKSDDELYKIDTTSALSESSAVQEEETRKVKLKRTDSGRSTTSFKSLREAYAEMRGKTPPSSLRLKGGMSVAPASDLFSQSANLPPQHTSSSHVNGITTGRVTNSDVINAGTKVEKRTVTSSVRKSGAVAQPVTHSEVSLQEVQDYPLDNIRDSIRSINELDAYLKTQVDPETQSQSSGHLEHFNFTLQDLENSRL